jgi:hypothetical protein
MPQNSRPFHPCRSATPNSGTTPTASQRARSLVRPPVPLGERVACGRLPYGDSEGCRSGRTGRSRKPLGVQASRGFKSLPLRFLEPDSGASCCLGQRDSRPLCTPLLDQASTRCTKSSDSRREILLAAPAHCWPVRPTASGPLRPRPRSRSWRSSSFGIQTSKRPRTISEEVCPRSRATRLSRRCSSSGTSTVSFFMAVRVYGSTAIRLSS